MADQLTRTTSRRRRPAQPPTRLVLMRGGGRPGDRADTAAQMTAIEHDLATVATLTRWVQGVVWGVGLLVAVYLAGLLGFRNGFVSLVGMPELQQSATTYLADGIRLVLDVPRRFFDAGLGDTVQWLIAMGVAIVGGGGLAIAVVAGDRSEDRSPVAVSLSAIGAVLISVISVGLIAWTIGRSRLFFGAALPWDGTGYAAWLDRHIVYAGLDVVGLIAAILWFAAAVRIHIWLWLRLLTIALAGSGLIAAFTAAAMSNGTLSQIDMNRTLVRPDLSDIAPGQFEFAEPESADEEESAATADADGTRAPDEAGRETARDRLIDAGILIGHTESHLVLLMEGAPHAVFVDPEMGMTAIGRRSLSEVIAAREAVEP